MQSLNTARLAVNYENKGFISAVPILTSGEAADHRCALG